MYFSPVTFKETSPFDEIRPIEKADGTYEMVRGMAFEWKAWNKLTEIYAVDPVFVTGLMVGDTNAEGMTFQEHFWKMVGYVLRQYDEAFEDFEAAPPAPPEPDSVQKRIDEIEYALKRAKRELAPADRFNAAAHLESA